MLLFSFGHRYDCLCYIAAQMKGYARVRDGLPNNLWQPANMYSMRLCELLSHQRIGDTADRAYRALHALDSDERMEQIDLGGNWTTIAKNKVRQRNMYCCWLTGVLTGIFMSAVFYLIWKQLIGEDSQCTKTIGALIWRLLASAIPNEWRKYSPNLPSETCKPSADLWN